MPGVPDRPLERSKPEIKTMTYRKSNRRPRLFRDDSAVGVAMDLATIRLLAKLVADELESRESALRYLPHRRPPCADFLPTFN
jgi:hypothetical protein